MDADFWERAHRLNEQSLDFVRHQLRGAEGGAGGHVERHVFVLRVGVVHLGNQQQRRNRPD